MCRLAISLLAMDYGHLARELREIEAAGIDRVHIDMMDGTFVPNLGIGIKMIERLRLSTGLFFDVHMMIQEPQRFVERIVDAGADNVTVHYESCNAPAETLRYIKSFGVKAGIALNPGTAIEVLDGQILKEADVVHLMTTPPGVDGQTFIPESLEKIAALRQNLKARGYDMDIEVDGDITKEKAICAVMAGATIIVSGRALVQGDMIKNIQQMKAEIQTVKMG